MVQASRRPIVSHPALTKRRVVALERVTLRPAVPKSTTAVAPPKKSWRAAQGVAACALIAAVPLAHAASPDPIEDAAALVASPPQQVALAPEPLERSLPPRPEPIGTLGARESVAEIAVFAKLEGVKANPYDGMATRPSVNARARIVRKPRAFDAGPSKVSELKANPYDAPGPARSARPTDDD